MNFLEVKCVNRGSILHINIDRIAFLKMAYNELDGKKACHIVLDHAPADNKGAIEVMESVEEIRRRINHPPKKTRYTVADIAGYEDEE